MWRGGFRLTVKLVKTEFHSGRLAVVFVPSMWPMANPTTIPFDKTVFLHRNIIDIREGNEFTFDFPYNGFTQYRPTSLAAPNSVGGQVFIYVVNSLVAPANVSSTVTCLFEWSATPDFEFAQPINPTGSVIMQATPQIGRSDCEIVSESVGGANSQHPSIAAESCIGERILSLRSLLKKFSLTRQTTDPSTVVGNRTFSVRPYAVNVAQMNVVPTYIASTNQMDMFDRIASMYAFYRGGMRMKFVHEDKLSDSHIQATIMGGLGMNGSTTAMFNYGSVLSSADPVNRPFAFSRGDGQGACEVEFPFYSFTPMMCIADYLTNPSAASPPLSNSYMPLGPNVLGFVSIKDSSGAAGSYPRAYRAIAEDGSLGLFVSTPPMIGYDYNNYL
jgi:hypothetical protein